MATIGTLTANLTLESAAFINNLSRSADAMNRTATQIEQQTGAITGGFNKAAGALKSFAAGFVGTLSVGAVANMAKETFAWADSLQELGERVGFSVEKLQELQQAGALTNTSQQEITNNLEQFTRRLGEAASGTGELAEVLEANNIALTNSDGTLRTVSEVFDDYVELIANAGTKQEKLSLAVDGFGRSGAGFVTTIEQMESGLNSFNVLTDEQVATLAKYDDKITKTTELLNFGFKAALASIISSTETDINNIVAIWDKLHGAIDSVVQSFVDMKDSALAAVDQMVSGIEQALGQRMKRVAQASAGTTVGIALQWKKLYDAVIGQSYVPDMMDGIEREFKRLPSIAVAPTKAATAAVDSEFARLAERQQQHVQAAMQNGVGTDQQADVQRTLETPFSNALQNIQAEFTNTFDSIAQGAVRSFQDVAAAAHGIFTNLASNIATLAIFDPAALKKQFAAAGLTPGQGQLVTAGAFATPLIGLAAGLSGNQGAQQGLQYGGAGGAAVGALVGSLVPVIGTALGATAGGLLGSVGGGLLGGLLGGGSQKGKGTISGSLGQLGFSGSGLSQLKDQLREFDNQMLGLLNERQKEAVNQYLKRVKSGVEVNFKGELTADVIAGATGQRARAIGRGLGFRNISDAGDIRTALETQRAIEDLTGSVTAFERQVDELDGQFETLTANAKRFGISLNGLAQAQREQERDLRRQQDAAIAALLDPFEALQAPLRALATEFEFVSLVPAQQFAKAQQEFERIAAEAEAGSVPAIQQLEAAARLFVELAGQVGASPGQAAAVSQVQSALDRIGDSIERSQAEASQGVEGAIDRHRREEIDTLNELRDSIVDALRKLESTVRLAR